MSETNGASKLGFFLAGIGIGAVLAILFAPKTGKETREYIAQKAGEGRDYVKTRTGEIRRQAEEAVEKTKDVVTREKERLAKAFEVGKEAYDKAKVE